MKALKKQAGAPLELPSEPSTPEVSLRDFRFLLHGWPKSGKSCFANCFKRPFFLRAERGTKGMSVYGLDIGNWTELCEAIALLKEEGEDRFDTVVIDTLDRAWYYLTEQVALDNNVAHISALSYGRGTDEAKRRLINMLEDLFGSFGVVLITHSRYFEEKRGALAVTRIVPNLSPSPREVITGWVDQTIYFDVRDQQQVEGEEGQEEVTGVTRQHVATCQLTESLEAGGRLRGLPLEIPLGNTPREGFKAFEGAFATAADRLLEEFNELQAVDEVAKDAAKAKGGKRKTTIT